MAQTTSSTGSTKSSPPGTTLSSLLLRGARSKEISEHLDALPAAVRLEQVLAVTGSSVGELYDAVADAPRVTLAEFCPPDLTEGKTLIYEGRNSLPAFNRFQKRFQRRGNTVVGYNHQATAAITGPGYFVTVDGDNFRDELLFDYTQVPPFFPPEWPAYKPNNNLSSISLLVYHNMKDYCRHVARGVVVGKAYKNNKAMGAYFTLTLPQ